MNQAWYNEINHCLPIGMDFQSTESKDINIIVGG